MPLQDQHAVDFIIETLRREPAHTVTLCPLGPLTNIAAAFLKAPDIMAKVGQIVLMGGAYFEVGNITPAAGNSTSTLTRKLLKLFSNPGFPLL